MTIAQSMLPELDHEAANTRRLLERVPDEIFGWKPHDKCGTTQWLVSHLASLPGWACSTLETSEFDFAPVGGEPVKLPTYATTAEAVAAFDGFVAAARELLAKTSDEALLEPWALLKGGEVMFKMPRVAVLRGFILNHLIHHRAQLGMYLRLKDIPLPAIYGPSADEGTM